MTPEVLLGGAGLLAGHWLLSRLLGLRFLQTFLSLLIAIGAGFGFYFFGASGKLALKPALLHRCGACSMGLESR